MSSPPTSRISEAGDTACSANLPAGIEAYYPVLVVEVGSTVTKANAFDVDGRHLAQGFGLTSVDRGDVAHGIIEAVTNLSAVAGQSSGAGDVSPCGPRVPRGNQARSIQGCPVSFSRLFVNSSAAGGLKMTVHGLTLEMTARAAREASLGAGAIVKLITAGRIKPRDCEKLAAASPNIVILAGGTDFGDDETVIENARILAQALGREAETGEDPSPEPAPGQGGRGPDTRDPHDGVCHMKVPVLYAGNAAAWEDARDIFDRAGVEVTRCDNVYPALDELNVEPAREKIMDLFARHIVRAPGMRFLSEAADGSVFPTPAAVMEAAGLFRELYGDVAIIDVGGATTDIHSVTEGSDAYRGRMIDPEPLAKRTVEGDLGVFVNAGTLNEARIGRSADEVSLSALRAMPSDEESIEVSRRLAAKAVLLGVRRHAGTIRNLFTLSGRTAAVKGRDLTALRHMIGTGGALTRLPGGIEALRAVCTGDTDERLMPPPDCRISLDRSYLFSAIGTLALNDRDLALKAAKRYFGELVECKPLSQPTTM